MPQFKDAWKKSIFRFEKRSKFVTAQINITPLIDVIFLLLIFFMLTSTFVSQAGIKVNLPKAVSSKVIAENRLVVVIDGNNQLYVHNKIISLKELKTILEKASKENKSLLIMSDKTAAMGKVVEVWDLCRQTGISQINIASKAK